MYACVSHGACVYVQGQRSVWEVIHNRSGEIKHRRGLPMIHERRVESRMEGEQTVACH